MLLEKKIMLPSENIKGGINGGISQYNLLKMIKNDCDKIAVTLSHSSNNITLWIIPKLEAGKTDDDIIKEAKKCEKQAKINADKYKNNQSEDNFKKACKNYKKAIKSYKWAYDIKKNNGEDTKDGEKAIIALKIEFYLFKLDHTMPFYLSLYEDRKKVKEIFNDFKDLAVKEEKEVFNDVIKLATSKKNDEKCSIPKNFACAYSYEFLEDYISASKSYLILSKQQHNVGNSQPSAVCMKKAEDLVSKLERKSLEESFATKFLEFVDKEWLSQTISDIPGGDYFKILLEEDRLKTIAYGLKEEAQKKAQEYNFKEAKEHSSNQDEKEKNFIAVCEAYQVAINSLNSTYIYIKNNNRNSDQVETDIHELQEKYFEFKLNPLMDSYLPEASDQNSLRMNISSLVNKKNFFVNKVDSIDSLLKSIEQIPKKNRSLVDHFKCAYIYEFLEDPISASQHYFLLCKKYLQDEKPELSVRCLEKADNLIRKEAKKQPDNISIANFLEKLDINFINDLYNQIANASSYESCKSYLNKIILEKQSLRKTFEDSLYRIKNHSNKGEPSCFICFNEEEPDVQKWLSNILVPDLKRTGIKTIFALEDLREGEDLNNFQEQICEADFAIIACTPLLKKKFKEQKNAPDGSALEIKLAIERSKNPKKHGTTYLIYLKGDKESSCPSVFFKSFVGTKLNISGKNTDFNYYHDALNIFAHMRKVNTKKLEHIENDFKSKVDNILTKTVNTINIKKTITSTEKCNETKPEDLLFEKLKEFYCSQANIETLIEERTLSIEDIYVRLAIIKEDKEKKDGKIKQSPEDGRWPTYETIYDSKESIKIEELFKHEKLKQKKEKRVIVWGAAGAGKSTCLHHIAHEWANRRLWNEFKAVFWICLRNLNADYYPPLRKDEEDYDAYYLIAKECRLLSREYNFDLSTLRSLLINKEFGNNTLLVLDGYDELPYTADRGHLVNAFKQFKEIFPNILISSRPQSVSFIQNPVEVEILGFDQKGVDKYIGKFYDQISKTSELSSEKLQNRLKDLYDLLKQKPLIHSLSCIPINLELLCCLYFFEEELDSNALNTITSLYSHIINWLCKRFLLKPGVNQCATANIKCRGNLFSHPQIAPLASKFAKIAWYGMKKQIRDFNQAKLENKFALDIDTIRPIGLLSIKNKMANFIHLTFQEYFAAVYLAYYYLNVKSKKIKKDIAKNKLVPRYALVFEMTAGYLSSLDKKKALQKFFDDLLSEPYDLAVSYELNLLARCFEECKDPSIIKQYAKFIEFTAGYIQNNWFINNHYIAQLLRHNPGLLSQEKIYQVILEAVTKCEEILINQDSKLLSEFAIDVIVNTYSFNNIEEGIAYVQKKFTDFLEEIAQANHEIYRQVINIFTKAIESTNSNVRICTVRVLGKICRSEKAFDETLPVIVQALTEALSDEDEYVRGDAAYALGSICRPEKVSEETLMAVVKTLTEALSDKDIYVQAFTDISLEKIYRSDKASEKTVMAIAKAIIEALEDADQYVKIDAANVLKKIYLSNKASEKTVMAIVQALTEALSDANLYIQSSSARALVEICRSERTSEEILMIIAKALTEALSYAILYIPSSAAEALGNICRSEKISEEAVMATVQALTEALSDAEGDVQIGAAEALGNICRSEKISEEAVMATVQALTEALSDAVGYVQGSAAKALGEICRSEKVFEEAVMAIVQALTEALSDAVGYVQIGAAEALGKICRSEKVSEETVIFVVKILAEALSDAVGYVRRGAAEALGEICRSEKVSEETVMAVVKILSEALSDKDEYVRRDTAKALGNICRSEKVSEETVMAIVKALTEALSDKDKYVRRDTANVLGEICQSEKVFEETVMDIVKAFAEALSDKDKYVRRDTAKALGEICQSEKTSEEALMVIVKALTDALSDKSKYVRIDTAKALGEICQSEKTSEEALMDILKALTEALSDKDECVRRYTAKALCNIRQVDEVFPKLVLKGINIGNWLENKKDIDCFLKNVNILGSIKTRYVIKLCNCTDYVFSYSNKKICIADIGKGELTSEELKKIDIFGMIGWRV